MQRIKPGHAHALYGVEASRAIERAAQAELPAHTLMHRAGLAIARLAQAVAPHAQRVWIACGPGNNGGDGLEAAIHLQRWGKSICVTWLGSPDRSPADSRMAYQRAVAAGIQLAGKPDGEFDLCIDALLGLGAQVREPQGQLAEWIDRLNASDAPVLAVDVPSGLDAGTGAATARQVRARHTLSLLTLKPGLFTAQGRDAAGTVWFDDLGVDPARWPDAPAISAELAGSPALRPRPHASHKGSYGDVAVIGGATGMSGAALLAGMAALHAGAGRVFVALLSDQRPPIAGVPAELMFRTPDSLDLSTLTVVCGCGGGDAVRAVLPTVLAEAPAAVIDADGLNALAADDALRQALARRTRPTVLTPHPLEAARLLGCSAAEVQRDRLAAAQRLSRALDCTVVLKGSGTLIATSGRPPALNPTGNARLATAGTGDVLAGMIGALMAAGMPAFEAACHAVYRHGEIADLWPQDLSLTAGQLAVSWSDVNRDRQKASG